MERIIFMIFMLIAGGLFLVAYFVTDRIITNKRIAISQREWDEYCKQHNLRTIREKGDAYIGFCGTNRARHNWNFYYFPKMNLLSLKNVRKESCEAANQFITSHQEVMLQNVTTDLDTQTITFKGIIKDGNALFEAKIFF